MPPHFYHSYNHDESQSLQTHLVSLRLHSSQIYFSEIRSYTGPLSHFSTTQNGIFKNKESRQATFSELRYRLGLRCRWGWQVYHQKCVMKGKFSRSRGTFLPTRVYTQFFICCRRVCSYSFYTNPDTLETVYLRCRSNFSGVIDYYLIKLLVMLLCYRFYLLLNGSYKVKYSTITVKFFK